jgi:chromosome segregation ATPase
VVVRLEGEVDELQRQLAAVATSEWDRISRERDEARTDNDRLRESLQAERAAVKRLNTRAGEVDRLRGLLREACDWISRHGELSCDECFQRVSIPTEWYDRSRAALEGKP